MQSRSRYVVVSILLLAVVAAIPLSHAFQWVWIQAGWDDRPLIAEIPISACLAYLIAATSAIFVLRHQPTYQLELLAYLTLVSLCMVCFRSNGQYFFNCNFSPAFLRFLVDV